MEQKGEEEESGFTGCLLDETWLELLLITLMSECVRRATVKGKSSREKPVGDSIITIDV